MLCQNSTCTVYTRSSADHPSEMYENHQRSYSCRERWYIWATVSSRWCTQGEGIYGIFPFCQRIWDALMTNRQNRPPPPLSCRPRPQYGEREQRYIYQSAFFWWRVWATNPRLYWRNLSIALCTNISCNGNALLYPLLEYWAISLPVYVPT
jgi:hypothetical protein